MRRPETNKVYKAIADPTRRAILEALTETECSVKELTARFTISQPAVSQHLGELRAAKLVKARKFRRENLYRLTASPLHPVIVWLDGFRRVVDPAGHHWAIGPLKKGER